MICNKPLATKVPVNNAAGTFIFSKNNIKITDQEINEYLSKIENIKDNENIINNLRYDLQRKKYPIYLC